MALVLLGRRTISLRLQIKKTMASAQTFRSQNLEAWSVPGLETKEEKPGGLEGGTRVNGCGGKGFWALRPRAAVATGLARHLIVWSLLTRSRPASPLRSDGIRFYKEVRPQTNPLSSHSERHNVCSVLCVDSSAVTCGKKRVNGVDLYYERMGKGRHALLLLPGALGSTRTDFGPQLNGLNQERFTVIGWDPRGYGQSRPPDRDFPADFFQRDAKDAVDLMKTLGFGKFSLLGWSDGGITALVAAAANPDAVHKLVVWGANSFVSKQDEDIYNAVRDVSQWSARMRQPMEQVYGAETFARIWEGWVAGISQYGKRPGGSICTDVLPLITSPTLIIHGEKDPMVPGFHPQYLLQHISGSRLHLMPEGKHNLHLRYATEFNKLVEDFLEE